MRAKFLTIVWALGFTYILWAPLKTNEVPEQSGLFDYTETEFVGWRERTEPDQRFMNTPCGSGAMFPTAETQTRYKAPQFAATITTTGLAWFLVGVALWRRGA